MALFCICMGLFFSVIFHLGVKEPSYKKPEKQPTIENSEKGEKVEKEKAPDTHSPDKYMRIKDWFKEIAFYQVALLYMATRLFVNLYQVSFVLRIFTFVQCCLFNLFFYFLEKFFF